MISKIIVGLIFSRNNGTTSVCIIQRVCIIIGGHTQNFEIYYLELQNIF